MADLRVAHTSALDDATLAAARALLAEVFEGDFGDEDWEHALGGMHALIWEDGVPIGHASVVQRRLLHGGQALRAGYVEGVGVRVDRRRRGHGATLMRALEQVVRRAYDLGALGAATDAAAFYATLGRQPWRGPCSALTPAGIRRTPEEEGNIHVPACGAVHDARLPLDVRRARRAGRAVHAAAGRALLRDRLRAARPIRQRAANHPAGDRGLRGPGARHAGLTAPPPGALSLD